VKLVEQTQTRH